MDTILIVDDSPSNLKSYAGAFKDHFINATILTRTNEDEAIQLINDYQDEIDVIITDYMMIDDKGGLKVLNAAIKKDPFVMVIIITAFDQKLDRLDAMKLGAIDCLEKATPGQKTVMELIYKTTKLLEFRKALKMKLEFLKFKRFFDPSIFSNLNEKPEMLNPQKKWVTISFWDIRGFTKVSEKLIEHPTVVASFLQQYLELSAKIIFKHGGVLDKFIGDGVMAIFGAFDEAGKREAENASAVNAIKAAKEMMYEFKQLHSDWANEFERYAPNEINFGLGCGVHSSNAIVGMLGTDFRDHFTAIGRHVNFASRLSDKAENGEIIFSGNTFHCLDSKFKCKEKVLKDIKGIEGDLKTYVIEE